MFTRNDSENIYYFDAFSTDIVFRFMFFDEGLSMSLVIFHKSVSFIHNGDTKLGIRFQSNCSIKG